MPGQPTEPLARAALREARHHGQSGAPPPISVHDCLQAVRLVDQAYEFAGRPYG